MTRIKTFLTTIIFLTALTFVFADTSSQDGLKNKTGQLSLQQSPDTNIMSKAKAYKMLYDNSKDNNDKLTSSIQWMIGISVTFLLAILLSQIFFNWRINKREIDYIRKDIEERISSLKASLIKDIQETSKEQNSSMLLILDKLENEIKQNVDEQFKKKAEFSELKDKMLNQELEILRKDIDNDIKGIKIDVGKAEGDLWKLKGVESNALSSYLDTALLLVEKGREVKYILDEIIEILTNLEDIHELDSQKLDELTGKLTIIHGQQKEQIIKLYRDKSIYHYIDNPNYHGQHSLLYGGAYLKVYIEKKKK